MDCRCTKDYESKCYEEGRGQDGYWRHIVISGRLEDGIRREKSARLESSLRTTEKDKIALQNDLADSYILF
jgi:hypothetical protein